MIVTIRSSSSDVISPALQLVRICFSINLTASVPFVQVDISLLADQIGVATSDTLDLGQRIHDLLFAIDVGVEKTEDELEVRLLSTDESCRY